MAEIAGKKSRTVRERKKRKCLAKVCPHPLTAEENLEKLRRSTMPMTFVKNHDGAWNHQDWLGFLDKIHENGYDPICADSVGLILEDCKAKYLEKKNNVQ